MNIFDGLEKIVKENYPLAKHSWYGIGGRADYFIQPETTDQLSDAVRRCSENDIPFYVMGFGSNLLISDDGLKAAVIKLQDGQFQKVRFDKEQVTAGAGAELSQLVLDCVRKGLSGIEALTGVPGSVGGAIKMNSGGNFGDIGSAVQSVTVMDKNGTVFEKSRPELVFDYRRTNITAPLILNATINLNNAEPDRIMKTVKEIWFYKKNNQPLNTKNCGCIFKNPPAASAGAMIDRAGLKGLKIGAAAVSEKHANFIIAEKGCKSRDVIRLIEVIKQRVKEHSGVELELEIEIWN